MKEGEKLSFVKIEEIDGNNQFDVKSVSLSEDLPIEEVDLGRIVSAFGIDSWEEALNGLPPTYLRQLTSGEITGRIPILLQHDGVYIGTGLGNRTITLKKLVGEKHLSAHIAPFNLKERVNRVKIK